MSTSGYHLDNGVLGSDILLIVEASVINVADTERLLDRLDTLSEEAHSGDDLVQTVMDADLSLFGGTAQRKNLLRRRLDDALLRRGHVVLDLAAQSHDVVLESDEGTAMVFLMQTDGVVNSAQLTRDGTQEGPETGLVGVLLCEPRGLEVDTPSLDEGSKVGGDRLILDNTVGTQIVLHETIVLPSGLHASLE